MKTTETKHTPTPWFNQAGTQFILGTINGGVANIAECRQKYVSSSEAKSNAAFIVRACNEHAALCAVAAACGEQANGELVNQALANLAAIRNQNLPV